MLPILTANDLDNATIQVVNKKLVSNDPTKIPLQSKGAPGGVAGLDVNGKVPIQQLPSTLAGGLIYKGMWNAKTNSPPLVSGQGSSGFLYQVSVEGHTLIDGNDIWKVGDSVVFSGNEWELLPGGLTVRSVGGKTGDVTLVATDITDFDSATTTLLQPVSNSVNAVSSSVVNLSSSLSSNVTLTGRVSSSLIAVSSSVASNAGHLIDVSTSLNAVSSSVTSNASLLGVVSTSLNAVSSSVAGVSTSVTGLTSSLVNVSTSTIHLSTSLSNVVKSDAALSTSLSVAALSSNSTHAVDFLAGTVTVTLNVLGTTVSTILSGTALADAAGNPIGIAILG